MELVHAAAVDLAIFAREKMKIKRKARGEALDC